MLIYKLLLLNLEVAIEKYEGDKFLKLNKKQINTPLYHQTFYKCYHNDMEVKIVWIRHIRQGK
ncbi:hypothetical protein GCM10008906_23700 [Clostridium oceanicum]|uniref:Uncharacterized protein n=1 Tax=Clostridium oceanicum TaxID=1543 RepID=A0ABP3USS7_9CLOT